MDNTQLRESIAPPCSTFQHSLPVPAHYQILPAKLLPRTHFGTLEQSFYLLILGSKIQN